jgi:hypothetical protein
LECQDFRIFVEQVSHHPPISAAHAESANYELWMHTHVKSSFRGKSMEFIPLGSCHIVLKLEDGSKEHYTFSRPNQSANNLIIGQLYIDVHGKSLITNHDTGDTCELQYKPRGWGSKNAYKLEGKTKDKDGTP